MKSTHHRAPIFFFTILIFAVLITSCVSIQTPPTPAPVTETPPPPQTPTFNWFPATETSTPPPTLVVEPTPNLMPGRGEELLFDNFDSASAWNTSASDAGSVNISRNRITFAVQPQVYMYSLRNRPALRDFYAEINAHTSLCRGGDSYGMLIRVNGLVYYRYALACNGTVRLERINNGVRRTIQPATPSGDVPPGSPSDVRLGVWAVGSEMRFFLNGRYQFTVVDSATSVGMLGLFAQSAGDTAMTVTFSDLVVQSVDYIIPTITMTPTKTPIPTSTISP